MRPPPVPQARPEPALVPRVATAEIATTERPAAPASVRPHVVISQYPYSVRVASYPEDSRWAASTLQGLRERGEPAFFSPVKVRGERYRRLLIGRRATWEQAYEDARRLRLAGTLEEFTILRLPYAIAGFDASDDQWHDYTTGIDDDLGGAFETQEEAMLLVP